MPFDPQTLIACAENIQILADGECEPSARSVANRSYYAAYGVIRCEIERKQAGLFGSSGMHAKLCQSMKESSDPSIAAIGKKLDWLRDLRVDADYRFGPSDRVSMLAAKTALHKASKCIEKCSRLAETQWTRCVQDFAAKKR